MVQFSMREKDIQVDVTFVKSLFAAFLITSAMFLTKQERVHVSCMHTQTSFGGTINSSPNGSPSCAALLLFLTR